MTPEAIDTISQSEWLVMQRMFLGGVVGPMKEMRYQYQITSGLYAIQATLAAVNGGKPKETPQLKDTDPQVYEFFHGEQKQKDDALGVLATWMIRSNQPVPEYLNKHLI